MRDECCRLYIKSRPGDFSLTDLEDRLKKLGLDLLHHQSKSSVFVDGKGDGIDADLSEVSKRLEDQCAGSYQHWLRGPHQTIFTTLRWVDGGLLDQDYGLDGFDKRELQDLTRIFCDLFLQSVSSCNAVALVVAVWGYTEMHDWDAYVDRQVGLPDYLPEAIGIPIDRVDPSEPRFSRYTVEKLDGFILLTRPLLMSDEPRPVIRG